MTQVLGFLLGTPPEEFVCKFWLKSDNRNEMAAYFVKFKKAAAAILDFGCNFRFLNFSIQNYIMSICFKFHQNRSIFARVKTIFKNSRYPPPPSWISKYDSTFSFFVWNTFGGICVQNLVEIRQLAMKWQPITWNPRCRGRPSWILVATSGFEIFRFAVMPWVCDLNFIEIRW